MIWLTVISLASSLLLSTARISYDSTAIYFSNAKITAYTGQLAFFSNDSFTASAFQSTIQYTILVQIFGDQSARMLSWVCGLAILLFSLGIAEKAGLSRFSKIVLLILLTTTTAFNDLLGDGKIDLVSTLHALAAVYWILLCSQRNIYKGIPLIFAGILAGTAITGRPFNAFLLGIFVLLFYVSKYHPPQSSSAWKPSIIFSALLWVSLGTIPAGIFHLFINWLMFEDIFAFMTSISNINPVSGPWDNDPQAILALRLLYPLTVSFRNTPQSLGNISPLVITFLPAIFFKQIRQSLKLHEDLVRLTWIAAITLGLWIFSFFTVVEIRYVLFLWVIIYIFAARLIEVCFQLSNTHFQKIILGTLMFFLVFMIVRTHLISIGTYSPLDKNGNPQCKDYGLCDYLSAINLHAANGDRVLTLSAYRYYLRTDLFACSTSNEEYAILKKLSDDMPESFWEEVRRQGYQYIAYENDYTSRHLQFGLILEQERLPEWIQLERIDNYDTDLIAAYKIHYVQPPIAPEFKCEFTDIWKVKRKN